MTLHIVHFIGPINANSACTVRNLCLQALQSGASEIELHMSTEGGNMTAGFALYFFLKSLPLPLTTWNVGSVESVVVARLPKIGPFTASDLMTSWAGADGVMQSLVIEELPASAALLNTSIDLYVAPGAAPPASTALQFDLIASGQQAPLLSRRVAPDAVAGVLRAGAQFSVDALPPGIYTVRATVFAAGSAPGSISAMIRKR